LCVRRRAGKIFDRHALDGHRVDIEVFEFEPRRRGRVPCRKQIVAGIETHARRQCYAHGAGFGGCLPCYVGAPCENLRRAPLFCAADPRNRVDRNRAPRFVFREHGAPGQIFRAVHGIGRKKRLGVAFVLDVDLLCIDDLGAVGLRYDLMRGVADEQTAFGQNAVPGRIAG
jgi:hypothetical protein